MVVSVGSSPRGSPRNRLRAMVANRRRGRALPARVSIRGNTRTTLGFLALVGILLCLQFSVLTTHTNAAAETHEHKASPLQKALDEQRRQHEDHNTEQQQQQQRHHPNSFAVKPLGQKRPQQQQQQPLPPPPRADEAGGEEPSRRLNSTGDRNAPRPPFAPIEAETERAGPGDATKEEEKAPIPANPDQDPKRTRETKMRQDAASDQQQKQQQKQQQPPQQPQQQQNQRKQQLKAAGTNLERQTTQRRKQKTAGKKGFEMYRSEPRTRPDGFLNRTLPVDPLGVDFNRSALTPTNFTLRSQWHGVLLDAGRHYFEVDWIKKMLDVLAVLQYNCLHFRLTDDQAFNVRLDSQPGLAHHVGLFGNNKTYTPHELRDIVAYGKSKGITIWPEINVPGHGGGWAGIPGLVVQCPEFICQTGYGVPINVTHPSFRGVLTDVLREIIDIFDRPPYLHLGGDEVDMAKPCFREFGEPMFNYDVFEETLRGVIADVNYTEEQIIRWEMTGQRVNKPRAGKMPQYWFRVPGESAPSFGHNGFFASGGLYFDANEEDMAWKIFLFTRRYYHLPKPNFPIGIIAGTFELDSNFWYDRNVVGRLLAVTMGASAEVNATNGAEFYETYKNACIGVGFDENLCDHYGFPFYTWKEYKVKWNDVWSQWKGRICDRLTFPTEVLTYVGADEKAATKNPQMYPATRDEPAKNKFWTYFGTPAKTATINPEDGKGLKLFRERSNLKMLFQRLVPHVGMIVDLASEDGKTKSYSFLDQMSVFGFDMLQLRLVNDFGFAFKSACSYHTPKRGARDFKFLNSKIVNKATISGIGVIPEISLATNSGGMYGLGFSVPCPEYTCSEGRGVQNVTNPAYSAAIYCLIREVERFATAGIIHLGSDEREDAQQCFDEVSAEKADFDSFEEKLAYLLAHDGISSENIIRWSNEEGIEYADRLGSITQCRPGQCENGGTGKWVATVNLLEGGALEIFKSTRKLALQKPFAIFAEAGPLENGSFEGDIPQRMLAFAMGVSDFEQSWTKSVFGGTEWDEETFILNYKELCEAITVNSTCEEFVTSAESRSHEDALRLGKHKRQVCIERTKYVTRHIYRPEFQEQMEEVEIQVV